MLVPVSDPPAPPPRICLVDDHEVLRHQVGLMLGRVGFDVVASVGSCEEGFAAVTSLAPFAAVIDQQLPDGRGVDLCRRLSISIPSVRLVVHTGHVAPGLREEAEAAGAWAVIGKSIRGVELIAALRADPMDPLSLR